MTPDLTDLICSVQILLIPCESVDSKKGVGISRDPVTDSVALAKEAPPPHHLPTPPGCFQVLDVTKCLKVTSNV